VAAAPTRFDTPQGIFELRRYPGARRDTLQAWCAADTLLLEEAHRLGLDSRDLLVANDEHGALGVALQPALSWTDSALAALALQRNLKRNSLEAVPLLWSIQIPAAGPRHAVLRIPRQLPYFEYQLAALARCLPPGSKLLAAGMDKHLSPRTALLIEQHFGPTQRHPGRRKARLFTALRDERRAPAPDLLARFPCAAAGGDLCSLPNVFSRDSLDIGTRFLLEQLPRLEPVERLVDLACGNGVLGIAAHRAGLARQVHFCDESAMAIESARRNVDARLDAAAQVSFHHGDGLLRFSGPTADLILCNPPFHSNHAVDESAGRRLLAQCSQHLAGDGRLCLVANRHLDYGPTLRRGFASVEKLAQNRKFTIWLARRQD
jgi:16S rRNA G1207 methylase RsmC